MKKSELDLLNDLVLVNNNRMAVYQKAFKNAITETQLSPAVRQMVHDQEEALRASSALAKAFEESPLRGRPFAPHYKLI